MFPLTCRGSAHQIITIINSLMEKLYYTLEEDNNFVIAVSNERIVTHGFRVYDVEGERLNKWSISQ